MTWNPIKRYRLKNDWRVVATVNAEYTWTDRNNQKDSIIYVLKENGLGQRKCKHSGTGYCHGKYAEKQRTSHPMYIHKVLPWLEGQYDPEVPTYHTIKQKEFLDNLAGEIT